MLKNKLFTTTQKHFKNIYKNALSTLLRTDTRVKRKANRRTKEFQNIFKHTKHKRILKMIKPLRARGKPQMERVLTPSLSIIYPLTQKLEKGIFMFFSPFPLLDKRKVGGDSFLPQHLQTQTQNQYNSRFCHRITELATLVGINKKWGYLRVSSLFNFFFVLCFLYF